MASVATEDCRSNFSLEPFGKSFRKGQGWGPHWRGIAFEQVREGRRHLISPPPKPGSGTIVKADFERGLSLSQGQPHQFRRNGSQGGTLTHSLNSISSKYHATLDRGWTLKRNWGGEVDAVGLLTLESPLASQQGCFREYRKPGSLSSTLIFLF